MGAPATITPNRPAPKRAQRSTRSSSRSPAGRVSTPSRRTQARSASSPARRASARSASGTARRSRITPPGGVAMIPVHAVGGAAGAVGGIADSGLVVRMTRGRIWIAVLGVLLGGIVALNVWGLGVSASTSGIASKIDELERKNSVLAATSAKRESGDRIQKAAGRLGLITPTPKAISFVKARDADAAKAAERLAAGEVSVLAGLVAPEFAALADAAIAPAEAAVPVDPAAVAPLPAEPVAPDPYAPAPAEAAPAPAPETVTAPPTTATAPPEAGGGITP